MLKQRIIATLIIKNGIVVQSIGFEKYLPVGKPYIAVEALNDWGIDEIVILDIDASRNSTSIDKNLIKELSSFSQVPITVGGGIKTEDEIKELLRSGADKVSINQEFLKNPSFLQKASQIFGVQCIIASLDIIKKDNEYFVYDYINKQVNMKMQEALEIAQKNGAGEILLNNVDRDGKKTGFDLELIQEACKLVNIPLIALGGAKNAKDMEEAIKIKELSAVGASNYFHFMEHSVTMTKGYIKREVFYPIRLDSHITYKDSFFDEDARLLKKDDKVLASMIFEIQEKEII